MYQSAGREAIEKNTGQIVVSTGFESSLSAHYECKKSIQTPAYLKEPLEVLETPFIPPDYSALLNNNESSFWVVVYTQLESLSYLSCQINFLEPHVDLLEEATQFGYQQLRDIARR